jgi:hypothetical protein
MTGTVELDQDGTHLLIRFPYREDLVAMVKDLSGRRWDPKLLHSRSSKSMA